MIINNCIKFGYGDIHIGGDSGISSLSIWQIKTQGEVGRFVTMDKTEHVGDPIIIYVDYDDYKYLCKCLSEVRLRKIDNFEYKNYIFDFSNYNQKSLDIFIKALNISFYYKQLALAC